MRNKFVAGFMFNLNLDKVALIKKTRPEWQKGLLNGIGGRIEDGESSIQAMVREFKEETGMTTLDEDWTCFSTAVNEDKTWFVDFYQMVTCDEDLEDLASITDENIVIIDVANLDNEPVVQSLKWLIKMCLDRNIEHAEIKFYETNC